MEHVHQRCVDADFEVRALDVAASETDLAYYQEILRGGRRAGRTGDAG